MASHITPFLFTQRGARGAIVEIDQGLSELFGSRTYSPDVRQLLGEASVAMPLMASHLKFEGKINLQFQSQGKQAPVTLLVAQIDHHLQVRSMARAQDEASGNFQALTQGGLLAWMLDPRAEHAQRYQAFVALEGETLAAVLEGYFLRSEQLPTRFYLASSETRLVGLMIQRMPDQSEDDEAHWQHLQALTDTLTPEEMLAVSTDTLLHRLFHEEDRRQFDPKPVTLACHCSRASISDLLLRLGEAEVQSILDEQNKVEVTCEFCGKQYRYLAHEALALFQAQAKLHGNEASVQS
jgi:molecular chaperone Hsp33